MRNILSSAVKVHRKFDLKGSTVDRAASHKEKVHGRMYTCTCKCTCTCTYQCVYLNEIFLTVSIKCELLFTKKMYHFKIEHQTSASYSNIEHQLRIFVE